MLCAVELKNKQTNKQTHTSAGLVNRKGLGMEVEVAMTLHRVVRVDVVENI